MRDLRARILFSTLSLSMALAGLALFPLMASAGRLQVSPITFQMDASAKAQELWLTNTGTTAVPVQIRVQQWTQAGFKDVLTSTSDLVTSPSQSVIQAESRQLIRLARLDAQPLGTEKAYRIIVDELPSNTQTKGTGLNLLLRYSIPVFVGGETAVATSMKDLAINVSGDGNKGVLNITNNGPNRIKVSEISYFLNGKEHVLVPGLLGYVLSGSQMQWPLNVPASTLANAEIKARIFGDGSRQTIHAGAP